MPPSLANAPEIGGPGQIDPGGIRPDVFTGAPRPVIDNNMERLAASLGQFNSAVAGWHSSLVAQDRRNEAEQKRLNTELEKQLKEQALIGFNERIAAQGSDEVLNAIRRGEEPWTRDPFLKEAIPKFRAETLAGKLADHIDQEIMSGSVNLGDPSFNPDRYVLEKAQGDVAELRGSTGIVEYRHRLDAIRSNLSSRNDQARGKAFEEQSNQIAFTKIQERLDAGLQAGLTGATLNDEVRKAYTELGPRVNGGVFGISHKHLDGLYLSVLEHAAKDPAKAKAALSVLEAPRVDEKGGPLPPLSQNPNTFSAVNSIRDTATKTLQVSEKAKIEHSVNQEAITAFDRADGSFGSINDLYLNGPETGVAVEVKADALRKQAAAQWLQQSRQKNGVQLEAELKTFLRNGVEHPAIASAINNGFRGVGGTNLDPKNGPNDEQLTAVMAGAQAYNAAKVNPAYVGKHVDDKTAAYYETYNVLVNDLGMPEKQAAAQLAVTFSKADELAKTPGMGAALRDVTDRVKGIDFNEWYKYGGTASNVGELSVRVERMAKTIVATQLVEPDKAVEIALKRVGEGAAFVNGAAVVGTKLQKEDVPGTTAILDHVFTKYQPFLSAQGIDTSSHLTVEPVGNGDHFLVKGPAGPVMRPVFDDNGKPIPGRSEPLFIKYSDISKVTDARAQASKAIQLKRDVEDQLTRDEDMRRRMGMPSALDRFTDRTLSAMKRVGKDIKRTAEDYGYGTTPAQPRDRTSGPAADPINQEY